jgi:dephospho-CoA kinase
MPVFGLTGGIASGKTTVARTFIEAGVPVVDADEVARAVVAKGSEGLAAVVEAFGADVLDRDGALDRKALAARIFDDAAARRRLEGLLHPRIGMESARRFGALLADGHALVCYDAALLVENGLVDAFRPLVVVAAPRELQRARLIARDGLDEAAADARLDAQADVGRKLAAADVTIWNDGSREQLVERALAALDEVRRRVGG